MIKYYKYYQNHEWSSKKFNFMIKNDIEFNYNIIVYILYIEKKLILNIIDKITYFQVKRLVKDIFTKYI